MNGFYFEQHSSQCYSADGRAWVSAGPIGRVQDRPRGVTERARRGCEEGGWGSAVGQACTGPDMHSLISAGLNTFLSSCLSLLGVIPSAFLFLSVSLYSPSRVAEGNAAQLIHPCDLSYARVYPTQWQYDRNVGGIRSHPFLNHFNKLQPCFPNQLGYCDWEVSRFPHGTVAASF